MANKKFGMVYFNNFTNEDIVWGLLVLGREAEIIDSGLSRESTEEKDAAILEQMLKNAGIEVTVTFDFCPALSDACMKLGIPYIAWSFDAPIQMLYEKQVLNNCNYIFTFDKKQLEQLRTLGVSNAFYMPLGTNLLRNSSIELTKQDEERFTCDVSFIGSLYSDNAYNEALSHVSPGAREELDQIIKCTFGRWDGEERLYGKLSDGTLAELQGVYGNGTAMDNDSLYTTALLVRRIANLERLEMLNRLASYNLQLYTSDSFSGMQGITCRGQLDYIEELPKAYHYSRINMNITMRGITSGVPLRVFDIMGMGGFALTNYQPEVPELFSPGKDIEVYHDFDELAEKVAFYLGHEDARKKIAQQGYETIKANYTIEKQVEKILQTVGV